MCLPRVYAIYTTTLIKLEHMELLQPHYGHHSLELPAMLLKTTTLKAHSKCLLKDSVHH